MKVNFKSNLLLIAAAMLSLSAASCGDTTTKDEAKEGETVVSETLNQEASEVGAIEEEDLDETPTMQTSAVSTSSEVSLTAPTKGRGQWDDNSKMYNDDPRHLFWDLSFYKNWNVFPESKLPKNMLLAAENADNGIVATLTAIPVSSDIKSIWKMPKETYIQQSMAVQNKAFVKSDNSEPVVDKVEFRGKSAYETKLKAQVPDHRNGQKTTHEYRIRKVAVVNDGEIIEMTVMAPPEALKRFGDDTFTFLIGKFNIVE